MMYILSKIIPPNKIVCIYKTKVLCAWFYILTKIWFLASSACSFRSPHCSVMDQGCIKLLVLVLQAGGKLKSWCDTRCIFISFWPIYHIHPYLYVYVGIICINFTSLWFCQDKVSTLVIVPYKSYLSTNGLNGLMQKT